MPGAIKTRECLGLFLKGSFYLGIFVVASKAITLASFPSSDTSCPAHLAVDQGAIGPLRCILNTRSPIMVNRIDTDGRREANEKGAS